MRLLLDTNVLIPLVDTSGPSLPALYRDLLRRDDVFLYASVASVWEVAIKHRLGKLPLPIPLEDWPQALVSLNITSLSVFTAHVVAAVDPPFSGRDPFDQLLLGVCAAERMQLVTRDTKLLLHPLAWQPGSA